MISSKVNMVSEGTARSCLFDHPCDARQIARGGRKGRDSRHNLIPQHVTMP
jgi:hypothetical protein